MKSLGAVLASLLLISLTSCIEIIDDITINEDGSGVFRYNINLSSSKVKVNSILALDSLEGKKVPSIEEISVKLTKVVDLLKNKEGISNVHFSSNYTDYIFKLECDFSSIELLQEAIFQLIRSEMNVKSEDIPELSQNWLTHHPDKLIRSIPTITVKRTAELNVNDINLLKTGTYTSITRFYADVDRMDNEKGLISKNNKAVMIRTDPYSLTQNPKLLDNTIYLVKTE